MKKIRFVLRHITRIIVGFILSLFVKRDKNRIMFNASLGAIGKNNRETFLHNTKYLFLYLNSTNTSFKYGWLCDDEEMLNIFHENGYNNVYPRKSLKGIYYSLKAKYWIYDHIPDYLPVYLVYGATLINIWHGSGLLKKIGFDDKNFLPNPIIKKIYAMLTMKNDYYIIDGEPEKQAFVTAFKANADSIKLLGFPRLDALFKSFNNVDLFMEKDYYNITKLKEQGKFLFFYMPTWRDSQKNISNWLQSERLKIFLKENNAVLVCKLHPLDKNSLNFNSSDEFYAMNSDSDIYAILKFADCLISDYSSIYFDFLLLDKPIIYYVPDLEEYQEKCRGFYEPYEQVTAGAIVKNEKDLLVALNDAINHNDIFKTKRKVLRDRMFIYQNGGSCERVINFIEELK